jgi:hypothetical protein|tara:strand:+ start:398 stop:553 length:156 start_codon:yes stop_codon:yes gene_type:complete
MRIKKLGNTDIDISIIAVTSIKNLENNIISLDINLNKEIEDIYLSDPNPCV